MQNEYSSNSALNYNSSQMNILFSRVNDNPNLCVNRTCGPIQNQKKRKGILEAEIIVSVAGSFLIVALLLLVIWHIRKKRGT